MADKAGLTMIFFSIAALFLLLFVMLRIHKGVFLYPSIIMSAVFSASLVTASVSMAGWGVDIAPSTLFVIVFSVTAVATGELLYMFFRQFTGRKEAEPLREEIVAGNNHGTGKLPAFSVSWRTIIIQSAIMFGMLLYVMYQVQTLSGSGAATETIDETIQGARDAIISDNGSIGALGSLFNAVAQGLFFTYAYIFISSLARGKSVRSSARYLLPIILFLLFAFFSTTRTVFALIIIYIVAVATLLLYQKYRATAVSKRQINAKLKKPLLLGAILFVAMFTYIGTIRGSVQQYASPFESLRVYIASPIVALNDRIASMGLAGGGSGGACTVSSAAEKVGILLEGCEGGFIQYDQTPEEGEFAYTNVYTGIYPYMSDYGLFGLTLAMLLVGVVYASILRRAQRLRSNTGWIVLYAILLYAPLMFVFDDQFTELPVNITMWLSYILCVLLLVRYSIKKEGGEVSL